MIFRALGASALIAGFACTACSADDSTTSSSTTTPTPPTLGVVETFAELPASSEGLAFGPGPDGKTVLYVGARKRGIVRVSQDGTVTDHVALPNPEGMAIDAHGNLLVCGTAEGTGSDLAAVIWRVTPSGDKSVLVDGGANPFKLTNFIAVAPDGSLVFTDSSADRVFSADADGTNLRLVTDAIRFPNGMSFSKDGKTLFIASWDTKKLWSLVWNGDGSFGAPTVFSEAVENVDGVATFASGDLLFVATGEGVVRQGLDKTITAVTPGKALAVPANGAFGRGDFGEGWVYLTSLASNKIRRVWVGEGGAPLPTEG
jgi:gluconolactonase